MRSSALLLLALVATLAAPMAATADQFDNELAQLRPVVEQWWAGYGATNTHCGAVATTRAAYPVGDGRMAETMQDTRGTVWYPVCTIRFNNDWALTATPAMVCTLILHEWGHIVLGPQHSDDSTNIMYGSTPIPTPPMCKLWAAGQVPRKGQPQPLAYGHAPTLRHTRYVMRTRAVSPCRPARRTGRGGLRSPGWRCRW